MKREVQTSRPTHPLEELTFAERLVLAVLDHRVTRIRYQGRDRVIEPQLIGIHEAGEPMLVAYQTGGRQPERRRAGLADVHHDVRRGRRSHRPAVLGSARGSRRRRCTA